MTPNSRRVGEILLGFILLLIGLAAIESGSTATLLIGVVGLYFLARNFLGFEGSGRGWLQQFDDWRARSEPAEKPLPPPPSSNNEGPIVYTHALDAARRAGLTPGARVFPMDVGLMAFEPNRAARIFRDAAVPDDMAALQPYIQIYLPTPAHGRVRFVIRDAVGEVVFAHETEADYVRGGNLITPGARLPLDDSLHYDGTWTLEVSADDVPLAALPIQWRVTGSRALRQHISSDGEISTELKTLVDEARLDRMSLDELLAEQDEPSVHLDEKQEVGRRAQSR